MKRGQAVVLLLVLVVSMVGLGLLVANGRITGMLQEGPLAQPARGSRMIIDPLFRPPPGQVAIIDENRVAIIDENRVAIIDPTFLPRRSAAHAGGTYLPWDSRAIIDPSFRPKSGQIAIIDENGIRIIDENRVAIDGMTFS